LDLILESDHEFSNLQKCVAVWAINEAFATFPNALAASVALLTGGVSRGASERQRRKKSVAQGCAASGSWRARRAKGGGGAHKATPRVAVRQVGKLCAVGRAQPGCRASSPSDAGAREGLRLGGRLHGGERLHGTPPPSCCDWLCLWARSRWPRELIAGREKTQNVERMLESQRTIKNGLVDSGFCGEASNAGHKASSQNHLIFSLPFLLLTPTSSPRPAPNQKMPL
jgi:hypothetical protein